jgi:tetratricopeptide (TPR) repeat protein
MRRRALITAAGLTVPQRMLARLDDALALLPAPARPAAPAEIAGRLARARAWFDASDLVHLVADLPDLLATAHQAAENGSPDAYARLAACYDVATEAQFPTPERRGRLHTDLARAWWQWGRPDQAARALLAAHRQAPAEVRARPAIRTIVTDLLERHPRMASVRELGTALKCSRR